MIPVLVHNRLLLGLLEAAIAASAALAVAWAIRSQGVNLFGEAVVALGRGIGQIVAVGLILVVLLGGPWWASLALLLAMVGAAGRISARRARPSPDALRVSLYAIALGAGSVIGVMTALGVIGHSVSTLIPVGSMLIANAMNANTLALERFRSEVAAHAGEIEARLALGAAPQAAASPYREAALRASLMPPIDSLRSLGIVWIPGMMAGMVLSGSSPLEASIYQFVVLAMILASSGLTCLISTLLMSRRVFTPAEQLLVPLSNAM